MDFIELQPELNVALIVTILIIVLTFFFFSFSEIKSLPSTLFQQDNLID